MNEPKLIKCDNCATEGKIVFLGSLSSQGEFLIRYPASRHQQSSYSCIMSNSFTLIHNCGFTIQVESGIIQTKLLPPINDRIS